MSEQRRRNDQGKFMPAGEEALARNIRGAKFPLFIDKVLAQLPNQSQFIRDAVIEKLVAEGLLELPTQKT